jgi:hypothetical protein
MQNIINELFRNFNVKIKININNETVGDILKSFASKKRIRHIDNSYYSINVERKNCLIAHYISNSLS